MNEFNLKLLAADRDFYEGPCLSVMVPLSDGLLGIMDNHSDMMGAIVPGEVIFTVPENAKINGEERIAVVVSTGLLKVEKGEVLILVDSAELPSEIDENRAKRAADRAAEELLQKQSRREYALAQNELKRAMARLKYKSHEIN